MLPSLSEEPCVIVLPLSGKKYHILNRKLLLSVYLTVTLSYVFVSKATSMLTSMITDKIKKIKYRIAAIFVVRLV